ncbi:hypothetical protein GCM10022200_07040 [Microbacterium awajiense]|uniref:DUF4349 domain-containing protein n=1 Tax=Microbacterium awajiense TaxID=415214 RepID=A0ABP7A958_9MICO
MNTSPTASATLPELSDERVDAIEDELFARIADDRADDRRRSARRGRLWLVGGAAAAIIAVAAIISPAVVPLVSPSGSDRASVADGPAFAPDAGGADASIIEGGVAAEETIRDEGSAGAAERDIITNASATIVADDVAAAAQSVGEAAVAHGGYVESMNVGTIGMPVEPMPMDGSDMYYPSPYPQDGAWITVRVPSDQLTAVMGELSELGEVTQTSINRADVTEQAVDLRARIDAAQASVDRLTELMAEAGDLSDLIAAEAALSERQAMLESYQQQLESLEDQVAMSSLSVTITPVPETVEADPAGFTDGFVAGWNGLIATLNGIVIALGFLIPWLVVLGVIGLAVWGVVVLLRRRRRAAARTADHADAD